MRVSLIVAALTVLLVPSRPAQDQKIYTTRDEGVTLPRVIRQVQPQYTSEAMRQMIEGEVVLEAVVRSDGKVGDVTVKQSLDAVYGLDEQAIKAVKQWEFKPGTKDGKAINVLVDVKMRFTLR